MSFFSSSVSLNFVIDFFLAPPADFETVAFDADLSVWINLKD